MSAVPRSDAQILALASLGTMTATVAHEMRNLLGGLELYATLIAEQCAADGDLAPLTGRLLGGVKRLHAVAANLLSVARRPQAERESAPLDLIQVLTEVVDGTALALPGTGIRLETAFELAKAPVLGDAERLRQAFLNLVLNAVQAMASAHGRGTLAVKAAHAEGWVRVRIHDDGPGISAENRVRLFEPFFSTKSPDQGTGLGLWTVRSIMMGLGGAVQCETEVGVGTTFVVQLPDGSYSGRSV